MTFFEMQLLSLLEEQFHFQMLTPEEQRQYRLNYKLNRKNRYRNAIKNTAKTFVVILLMIFILWAIFAIATDM